MIEEEVYPLVGIPVPMEDEPTHTVEHPYCGEDGCICMDTLKDWYQDGLVSADDATRIMHGKTL